MAILHPVTISVSFFHITKALYGKKKKKWEEERKGKNSIPLPVVVSELAIYDL